MNDAVSDIQLRGEAKARSRQRFPTREPDEDDFTVKDAIGLAPELISKSVRHSFECSGYEVQRFVKMSGRGFYCLQVGRTSATPCANDADARQRVADVLESAGVRPSGDDLLVTRTGDRLATGLAAAFDDVNQAVGFMEL